MSASIMYDAASIDYAIVEVLPATIKDKNKETKIKFKYLFI